MFLEVGMRLARTGKPTNYYYYVIETYRNEEGKQKTRTVEALGSANVIKEKYNVEDAEKWCQEYIKPSLRSNFFIINSD
jgi:ribosomal protein S16